MTPCRRIAPRVTSKRAMDMPWQAEESRSAGRGRISSQGKSKTLLSCRMLGSNWKSAAGDVWSNIPKSCLTSSLHTVEISNSRPIPVGPKYLTIPWSILAAAASNAWILFTLHLSHPSERFWHLYCTWLDHAPHIPLGGRYAESAPGGSTDYGNDCPNAGNSS